MIFEKLLLGHLKALIYISCAVADGGCLWNNKDITVSAPFRRHLGGDLAGEVAQHDEDGAPQQG